LGVPLLIVVSPNKAEIYEDKLPRGWPQDEVSQNFEDFLSQTKADGIDVIDSTPILKRLRAKGESVFAKGGTHWNAMWQKP